MALEMDKRFSGTWHIDEMEVWDSDAIHLAGPAKIDFDDNGLGRFQFIAVVGFTDCRYSVQDGKPLVEFSWQGHDDSDETCGRGWAVIESDGTLCGRIFIHCADDSAFTANRESAGKG
jgi:hypothetical protein